jgi:hypothetical protein
MDKYRLLGFVLLLLVIPVVLLTVSYRLVTSLTDLATQVTAAIIVILFGSGVSLLFKGRGSKSEAPQPPKPDLRIMNPLYRNGGFSSGVQNSWSLELTVQNDGQKDGEIRYFHVTIAEIDPQNLGLALTHTIYSGIVNGIHPKLSAHKIDISIMYANQGPSTHLVHAKVKKLIAELAWEKETQNGFVQDSLQLQLIPHP